MSEPETDENLASDNQTGKSKEIETTIEKNEQKVEIESNKCSVTEKNVQECSIEIESNQINQKNNDEDAAKTQVVETTKEAEAKVDDKITTKTETATMTPTETNDLNNIKQTVPSEEPPEAIKISETTENNQIAQDAKASDETPNRIESLAEKNDNKTMTIKSITLENNSTTETSMTTTTTTTATATATATTTTTTSDSSDEYAEHITYTDDGNAIYTDPKTHHKYKWSAKENNWLYWKSGEKLTDNPSAASTNDNPYENEHYKWCSEKNQWILKAQSIEAATTTLSASQTETEHYKWDATKNAWIPKLQTQQAAATAAEPTQPDAVTYGIDKDGQRIYTDKDGVVFFWDVEKNAWFPKIDDDFMARYQMNYGFIDNTSASEEERKLKEQAAEKHKALELQEMVKEARAATEATAAGVGGDGGLAAGVKRKVTQEPPSWFDLNPEQNTKVYVSNLPLDITLDEFTEIMSKCGMIMRDPKTQKHKLKLYTEEDGQIKGDGLCDYIKVESVELALKILDEYEVRGHKIRVQRAKFQMRGEYNPALKPKRKKKDKEKLQKMKEKLFDWRPEKLRGERTKNEKVVILKNLFTPELFEKEVQLILDYQNDLREECSKCGTVRKVVIYDLHAEGVAQVNMSSPEEADLVIQMMQGRYFGKRQLTAEHWDGKTKYKIAETETAVKSRLNNWDEFLETDEDKRPTPTPTSTAESTNTIKADEAAA